MRVPVTWEGSRPRHAEDPALDNAAGWGPDRKHAAPAEAPGGGKILIPPPRPSVGPSKLSRVTTAARSSSSEGGSESGRGHSTTTTTTTTGGSRDAAVAARTAAVLKEVTVTYKGVGGGPSVETPA
jgi:hypothetical protein